MWNSGSYSEELATLGGRTVEFFCVNYIIIKIRMSLGIRSLKTFLHELYWLRSHKKWAGILTAHRRLIDADFTPHSPMPIE